MIIFVVLGSVSGLVTGVILIPKIIQKREDKKLNGYLDKIKKQKLKYRINGKEFKFLEKIEKQLEKNKKKKEKEKKKPIEKTSLIKTIKGILLRLLINKKK